VVWVAVVWLAVVWPPRPSSTEATNRGRAVPITAANGTATRQTIMIVVRSATMVVDCMAAFDSLRFASLTHKRGSSLSA
jgi:hypothetical protein